jgi:hypothetical protein
MNAEDFKDLVGLKLVDVGDLSVSGGVELNFEQKDKTVGVRIFAKEARVEFFESKVISGKKAKRKEEPAAEDIPPEPPAERTSTERAERRKKSREPEPEASVSELPNASGF